MSKYTLEGLNAFAQKVHEGNKERGFWDEERNVGELLMLVVSELGEAMEALRKNRKADWDIYHKAREQMEASYPLPENPGYYRPEEILKLLLLHHSRAFEAAAKDTFEDEVADAVIRLLDLAAGLGIDLERHIGAKLEYNESRPYKHGKKF